jgi:hypothetical protein
MVERPVDQGELATSANPLHLADTKSPAEPSSRHRNGPAIADALLVRCRQRARQRHRGVHETLPSNFCVIWWMWPLEDPRCETFIPSHAHGVQLQAQMRRLGAAQGAQVRVR